MKKTTVLGHLICVMTNGCQDDKAHESEIREESAQNETQELSMPTFQGFDIDAVFAN